MKKDNEIRFRLTGLTPTDEFNLALQDFAKIALKLSKLWEQAQSKDENFNDIVCEGYPFQNSFDEVALQILDYAEVVKEALANH